MKGDLGGYKPNLPISFAAQAVAYSIYDRNVVPIVEEANINFTKGSKEWLDYTSRAGCHQCGAVVTANFRASSYTYCKRCLQVWFCSEECMQTAHTQVDCKLHEGYSGEVKQKWRRPLTDSTTESDSGPEKKPKLGRMGGNDAKDEYTDNSDLEVESPSESDQSMYSEGVEDNRRSLETRNLAHNFHRHAFDVPDWAHGARDPSWECPEDRCFRSGQMAHCSDGFNMGSCVVCNQYLVSRWNNEGHHVEHVRCLHIKCCGSLYCSNLCRDADAVDHAADYAAHHTFNSENLRGFGNVLRNRGSTNAAEYAIARTVAMEQARAASRVSGRASDIVYPSTHRVSLYRVRMSDAAADAALIETGEVVYRDDSEGLPSLEGAYTEHHVSEADDGQ